MAEQHDPKADSKFATELAIYDTAVLTTSLSAPNWAAFSRWMSAGAGVVVGGVLSSFVQFKLLDSPVSLLGASLVALSLVPALRIEWLYLILQPIGAAKKVGEEIHARIAAETNDTIDMVCYSAFFVDRMPPSLRKQIGTFMRPPMNFIGLAAFFIKLSDEGRNLVMWQLGLLTTGVLMLAAANVTFANWPFW